jgi:hypothetical protein
MMDMPDYMHNNTHIMTKVTKVTDVTDVTDDWLMVDNHCDISNYVANSHNTIHTYAFHTSTQHPQTYKTWTNKAITDCYRACVANLLNVHDTTVPISTMQRSLLYDHFTGSAQEETQVVCMNLPRLMTTPSTALILPIHCTIFLAFTSGTEHTHTPVAISYKSPFKEHHHCVVLNPDHTHSQHNDATTSICTAYASICHTQGSPITTTINVEHASAAHDAYTAEIGEYTHIPYKIDTLKPLKPTSLL